jgi:HD-GYP domain-containing protein (c-di-GMP phosphodiesterase class II)
MIAALSNFFRKMEPEIASLGIYIREGKGFRLASAGSYGNDGKTDENGASLEKYIFPEKEHETRGRFHIYTFMPENIRSAVRIVAYNAIPIEEIKPELYYLSAFIENLAQTDAVRTDLVKTKLVEKSKSIFTSFLFNHRDYFQLVATIILKGYHLDAVLIRLPDDDLMIGDRKNLPGTGKTLYVRNTDVKVEIFRHSGITQDDILNTGKFLDLISATIAMNSSKSHIANYINFLETAIDVFEKSDIFYRGHSERVRTVAMEIGASLGFDEKRLKALSYACKFHDIGMMGEIYEITSRTINLSEKEHAKIKYHPIIGYTITIPLDSAYPISTTILQHHELLDKSGYPNGVSSEEITLDAKILAFSEIFIGMMSDRPHRPGRSFDEAVRATETFLPDKLDNAVYMEFMKKREEIEGSLRRLGEGA